MLKFKKEEVEKTSLKLDVANNKSLELDNISNDIKELKEENYT